MQCRRTPLVEMRDISIAFGGIKAVDDASVDLRPGEVVGLLGHNGAGKSTLIKILSGAYRRDAARSTSTASTPRSPRRAMPRRYGIETIYQTLALADNVDAAANLFLGPRVLTPYGTLDDATMESETRKVMGRLNPHFRRFKDPVKVALRRPAPVGGDRARHPFQRPHPDHGRADGGARPRKQQVAIW